MVQSTDPWWQHNATREVYRAFSFRIPFLGLLFRVFSFGRLFQSAPCVISAHLLLDGADCKPSVECSVGVARLKRDAVFRCHAGAACVLTSNTTPTHWAGFIYPLSHVLNACRSQGYPGTSCSNSDAHSAAPSPASRPITDLAVLVVDDIDVVCAHQSCLIVLEIAVLFIDHLLVCLYRICIRGDISIAHARAARATGLITHI